MDPGAFLSPLAAQVLAWAMVGAAMVAVHLRYGASSFPFFFLAGIWFYLLVLPAAVGPRDPRYGTTGHPTEIYYYSVLAYALFYPLGVRLTAKAAFRPWWAQAESGGPPRNAAFRWAYAAFVALALGLVAYSLASRNVFGRGGDLLFTILGFDFLLVCYLLNRTRRRPIWNLVFFLALTLLFLYAGFRYRVALLFLAEVVVYVAGRGSVLVKAGMLGGTVAGVLVLAAFGQVRSYGSFDTLARLGHLDLDPVALVAASGEQTLYFATVNVVEQLDRLDPVGLQPIAILLTHFIPSAIFPGKPRADYLGAYLEVTRGLHGSGAAMHDMAQATLMFGHWGLPLASLLLGMLAGVLLRWGLRLSPNRYYACALLLLFAVFVPSRGYLAQQVTWGLFFTLPLALLAFASRLTLGPRRAALPS